ncbi:MAG: tyrosine-type recombinase/integrase [Candidatus Korobacteraceae bacterium]
MKIDEFINDFSVRTQSKETLRAYRQDLQRFESYLNSKHLRVTQVTTSVISDYVRHLRETAGRTKDGQLAPASITRRLAALSRYYEYLRQESNGKIRNPFKDFRRPKVDNDLPRAVEEATLHALLGGITGPRDKAIILVFLYTGLRLSELQQLDVDTITVREQRTPAGEVITLGEGEVIGKGSKRRRFLIALEALTAVAAYLKHRPATSDKALFLSERRMRMSRRAIQFVVQKWCCRLELTHVNCHAFRHSFATRMINAGLPSTVLRELMGHASFTSTLRYSRIRPERVAREYFAALENFNA